MNFSTTITTKPFDEMFFHIRDSFLTIPSLDISQISPTDEKFIVPQNDAISCFLCEQKFHSIFRKRCYCSLCGIPYCNHCAKTVIHNKNGNLTVCDACAAFTLSNDKAMHLESLKNWFISKNENSNKKFIPKEAAVQFFAQLLFSSNKRIHLNAAIILYRHSASTDLFKKNGVAEAILKHSIACECEYRPVTLDLFANLFAHDTFNFKKFYFDSPSVKGLDPHVLLRSRTPLMQEVASRFLSILVTYHAAQADTKRETFDLLRSNNKASCAYAAYSLCIQLDIPDPNEILSLERNNDTLFENRREIVQYCLMQFDKKRASSSVASRYYSSKVAAIASLNDEACSEILKFSLHLLGDWIDIHGEEAETSFYLIYFFLNLWKWGASIDCENTKSQQNLQQTIFSIVPIFMYEALSMPPEGENNLNCAFQKIFLEFIPLIAGSNEFSSSVKNDHLISLVSNFKNCDLFSDLASKALLSISS